ncbi:MAG: amidohydrolase family protein [Candidatus Cloacimonadaceae bacterium]|jgi:guanine deaminase|nr:amidohydrolase family protein [Candidatus Cloacimonadaceae bacterium]
MKHLRSNIFNPISPTEAEYLADHVLSFDGEKIHSITAFRDFSGAWEDYRDHIILPGLIDLHVHLSQYRIRGMYEPALLPWLKEHVFPEEMRSSDPDYARQLSLDFYQALLRRGTTFSVIYTAPFRQAADAAFEVARELGIRAKIGMTMMDMNSPEGIQQSTDYALKHSIELFEKWDSPFLGYIFSPRFAPTCSETLMRETGKYASAHEAFIQTHLSENLEETRWVKQLFGQETYTEVYADYGILGPRTILGHAIHLADAELDLLAQSHSAIAHCPDSNFYLKSGEYPLKRIADRGLPFGLGSDVGAGTTLNMLQHAKQMNFRQSELPVLPAEMLYHITLGSAQILGLQDRLGSLSAGKDADFILLKPPQGFEIGAHSLSQVCFLSEDFELSKVFVQGQDRTVKD